MCAWMWFPLNERTWFNYSAALMCLMFLHTGFFLTHHDSSAEKTTTVKGTLPPPVTHRNLCVIPHSFLTPAKQLRSFCFCALATESIQSFGFGERVCSVTPSACLLHHHLCYAPKAPFPVTLPGILINGNLFTFWIFSFSFSFGWNFFLG